MNKENFEQVMRAHGPAIYTLALRLCGNTADGQDLAQDTFLNAYRDWERFRGDAEIGTWLYRICLNRWKNRVRYEKRRFFWRHFSLDGNRRGDEEAPALEWADGSAPIDRPIEQGERDAALHRALAQLEPQERAILVLRDMEGRSYEDIAQLLELPLGTVKSRIARSRERLRERLQPFLKEA